MKQKDRIIITAKSWNKNIIAKLIYELHNSIKIMLLDNQEIDGVKYKAGTTIEFKKENIIFEKV